MTLMADRTTLQEQIFDLIRRHFNASEAAEPFVPGQTWVKLVTPSYGSDEVIQALESLLSRQLTLNQCVSSKVGAFERVWADYVGVQYGVMVNSGSSANLLALALLASPAVTSARRLVPEDEIITPAVTWTTTVSPIYQVGARPVFVDVLAEDLTIDPDALERARSPRTKAVFLVHLLGNPCHMDAIRQFADQHHLWVIEDCCEAHGAEWQGRRVGSFGALATFSFFFSHHLTTIEGGMIMTQDDDLADCLRTMRSQGVPRNVKDQVAYLERLYAADPSARDLDPRYLFATLGYNVRPTEIGGGFGLEQAKKIDLSIRRRQENARFYHQLFARHQDVFWTTEERQGCRHVYLGFPVMVRPEAPFSRDDLVRFLEERRIETRPIMTGLVTKHPALRHYPFRQVGDLPVAQRVHAGGLFLGTHPGISEAQRAYVAECIEEFMREHRR